MAFPRALRDAIPELHDGRELELDSVLGQPLIHPMARASMARANGGTALCSEETS